MSGGSVIRPTVMVVDDDQDNLTQMRQLLRRHYNVRLAIDGSSALAAARSEEQPDLILLDITMPQMDGYEVCRQLKAAKETWDIPVIFLSARTSIDDEKFGLELGAADYIAKPVSPPILFARVKTHINLKFASDVTRNKLAATLEAIPDLLLELDEEGNCLQVHAARKTKLAAYYRKLQGRNLKDLLPPEVAAIATESLVSAGRTGFDYGRVIKLTLPRGVYWFELSVARKKNVPGSPPHFIMLSHEITNRKRAEESLRHYAQRLIELDEKLRREMAAELHDEIGRDLTAIGLNISMLKQQLPGTLNEKATGQVDDLSEMLVVVSRRVRGLMAKLRPPVLDDYGLAGALRWHFENFSRRSGLTVNLAIAGDFPRIASEHELAFFRIAQEAINNTLKHANASTVNLSLSYNDRKVLMTISDDGCGFDSAWIARPKEESNWGLTIMRERAELIGGRFCVESAPGRGTVITVTMQEEKV